MKDPTDVRARKPRSLARTPLNKYIHGLVCVTLAGWFSLIYVIGNSSTLQNVEFHTRTTDEGVLTVSALLNPKFEPVAEELKQRKKEREFRDANRNNESERDGQK